MYVHIKFDVKKSLLMNYRSVKFKIGWFVCYNVQTYK